jgi:hypothetical protein
VPADASSDGDPEADPPADGESVAVSSESPPQAASNGSPIPTVAAPASALRRLSASFVTMVPLCCPDG